MKLLILFGKAKKMLFTAVLVAILSVASLQVAKAQQDLLGGIPHVPVLSLTGNWNYDVNLYPDGRLWVPPTSGEPREFLMPVFMLNNWYTYYYLSPTNPKFIADPIMSFEFSLMYNGRTLRAIGVETEAPEYFILADNEPLGKNFNYDVDDAPDSTYWRYLNEDKWAQQSFREKYDGRRFTITASSKTPLPHSLDAEVNRGIFQILCFVRFRVMATVKEGAFEDFNRRTPVYINPDVVRYNNVNVVENTPLELMSDYDTQLGPVRYPQPEQAVAGVRNDLIVDIKPDPYNIEPYKPGTIFINVFDRLPEFSFQSERLGQQFQEVSEGVWNLLTPIMVDSNSIDPGYGFAEIELTNEISGTRLSYIEIDSDEEWLQFKTVNKGAASKNEIPNITRSYLYTNYNSNNFYIDNGILGTSKFDPLGNETVIDRDVWLEIRGIPNRLNIDPDRQDDFEKTGRYEGTLTFKSPFAGINPVKLNVIFWYYRTPFEPSFEKQAGDVGGIDLTLINSNEEEIDLVFGTAHRATPGIDNLLAEGTYNGAMSTTSFDARFFPTEEPYISAIPNGFADLAPTIDNPRTRSRDIRDYNKEGGNHQYMVRFNASIDEYPIIVRWDTDDFPAGANLFIRDSYQGQYFPAANMRQTTAGEGNIRYFVISNPNLDRFVIEYNLPREQDFVGYDGEPLINKGWNLLSMPLRPENAVYDNVYTKAINIPMFFSQNQYQEPKNGILRVGQGYFVKYSDDTEESFRGTPINEINYLIDPIRVFPTDNPEPRPEDGGWNLIGSITSPITVDHVCFDRFQNSDLPDPLFTARFGVWAYHTSEGYQEVSTMLPGLGYWIKTNSNGYLKIDPELSCAAGSKLSTNIKHEAISNSDVLRVIDNQQKEFTLYATGNKNVQTTLFELPPVPSHGYFDVRYADNNYLTNGNEKVIRMQGVEYPIVIDIQNADADYVFTDAVTGVELGTIAKGESTNLVIENTANDAIKIAKTTTGDVVFGMRTYPNPVVANANFDFTLDENANVTIELFDALGNTVATVINNQTMAAGSYTENLDASNLATGSYIVKFTAGTKVRTDKLNVVK
jgi:hypothetical protein